MPGSSLIESGHDGQGYVPFASMHQGDRPDVAALAAAYGYGLVRNHLFIDTTSAQASS
jgi:prophage maintenance system killer protein